jgi:hypothetical protein
MFSCYQDRGEDSPPDYSLLGLESITVMDRQLDFKEGVLLDISGVSFICVTGMHVHGKETGIEYAVLVNSGETPSVGNVISDFSDVLTDIKDETIDGRTSCVVRINRNGYQERLVYIFRFFSPALHE